VVIGGEACEDGEVTSVPLETWVSIGTLLGVGLSIVLIMRAMVRDLGVRIDGVEQRLGARIDKVEGRLEMRIDEVEAKLSARINTLDDRIYALAAGLKPQLERTTKPSAGETPRTA
jgi:hypothetical protein